MTPASTAAWRRLAPLLDELLDLEPGERQARLVELEARDPETHAAVSRLLAGALAETPLDRSIGAVEALLFAEEPVRPSRIGERIGPFEITAELGRGGMGTVYAARRVDGSFEQDVAIKVVKGGLDSEEVLRRFLAERRILARLAHPHIARLIDGGVTNDGLPWFAMERVDGVPLTAFAARERLAARRRLELFLDVCAAVAFAHRNLVVHRDLKPSNVLVQGAGPEGGQVKLLDFGIAKLVGGDGDEGLTQTALHPMTPEYAAPEQEEGGAISTLTDVWQLGRLLGELLERPLSRDLERIAARACHEEPERRYPSVEALAEDARRFLDGRAVAARGDSAAYRISRFVRRHRLGVAAAALTVTALFAGLAVALWQAGVARREAERANTVKDFLISTFGEARPEVARGEETTAREILARGTARIDRDLAGDASLRAEMLEVVASIERELGAFPASAALWARALGLRQGAGHDPAAVAGAQVGLAGALLETTELERAEGLAGEAHAALSRDRGPAALETLVALQTLGSVHRRQRRLADAEREHRAALEGLRAALPADDGRTRAAIEALARTLFDQSRYPQAEALYRELLAGAERVEGADSLAAARAWADLGQVLDDSEQNQAAEQAFERSLALLRKFLDADHPELARALTRLGALYNSTGRLADARRVLEEAIAVLERRLEPDAHDVLGAVEALATVDYQAGDYEASVAGMRRVFAGHLGRLGPDNDDTLSAQSNVAVVLSELGRFAEAETLQREVIARRTAIDDRSGSLPNAYHVLGKILLGAGRAGEAIAAYDQAIAGKAAQHGRESLMVMGAIEAGARARLLRGGPDDLRQARDLIGECLQVLGGHPDANPALRGDALVTAARLDLLGEQDAEAAGKLDQAVAIRASAHGPRHWKTAEAHLYLGRALARLGRSVDARRQLSAAEEILSATPGREALLAEVRRVEQFVND